MVDAQLRLAFSRTTLLLSGAGAAAFCISLWVLHKHRRQAEAPAEAGIPEYFEDDEEEEESCPIEDLGEDFEDLNVTSRRPMGGVVTLHQQRRRQRGDEKERIFVRTFGCAHNTADSEVMLGLLQEGGYVLTNSLEDADLCVVNSCTVKNPSEQHAIKLVNQVRSKGKKVVLAGCVPQADHSVLKKGFDDVSLLGVNQLDHVVEVVRETLLGNAVKMLKQNRPLPSLRLPKVRKSPLVEIIAINQGCLGACTFCKTRMSRSKLRFQPVDELIACAKRAAEEGVREVVLTSEDTGAYGLDIGTNVVELPQAMVQVLRPHEGVMLKIGMTNPPYILKHVKAVAEVLKEANVYEFLHIPVQSGTNSVLRRMVREYTIEEFKWLVNTLREEVPGLSAATAIICGFPTETDADAKETRELLSEFKFPFVNISQFYARPGTKAARMQQIPSAVVRQRSHDVTSVFNSYSTNPLELKGKVLRVWFSDMEPKFKQTVGHTKSFTKVVIQGMQRELLGTNHMCRIIDVQKWHLTAELLQASIV